MRGLLLRRIHLRKQLEAQHARLGGGEAAGAVVAPGALAERRYRARHAEQEPHQRRTRRRMEIRMRMKKTLRGCIA